MVTLAWAANHETGVNSAGGGYKVAIDVQPALTAPYSTTGSTKGLDGTGGALPGGIVKPSTITVPYAHGTAAPTSTVACLQPGTYAVSVRAYAKLDAQGGHAGSVSAPSVAVTVIVPGDAFKKFL